MFFKRNCPRFVASFVFIVLLGGCGEFLASSDAPSTPTTSNPGSLPTVVAWGRFPRAPHPGRRSPLAVRDPDAVCWITPVASDQSSVIWNDRPLLVWSEDLPTNRDMRVVVEVAGTQQEVWSQVATANPLKAADSSEQKFGQVVYAGEPLQSGQVYTWTVFDQSDRPLNQGSFQVMAPEEQERVSAELAALEERLMAAGATEEEIAFETATYFAEQQLWSDALQVIFGVENPSPELVELRNQIPDQVCP